jgi:hypothetical protein
MKNKGTNIDIDIPLYRIHLSLRLFQFICSWKYNKFL